MTLKEAKELKKGDLITAKIEDPFGGESKWDEDRRDWVYTSVKPGDELIFNTLIPKIRIINNAPYNDGHDQLLFCDRKNGERAWLNIKNAQKING